MKKNIGISAIIALLFALMTFMAPAANAATANDCVTTGSASNSEVKMEGCAYSEASRNIDVTLQDRTTASGQVQLSYFNPTASSWSLAAANRCKAIYVSINWSARKIKSVVNHNKRKVNGTWCVRLKHGSTWANSGKDGDRKVAFRSLVRGSWSLMTLKNVRTGVWGHKGEYRDGRFNQVCDNEWQIGVKPTLLDTQVLMVRSEADVVYRNKTELTTNGSVTVEGSLNCPSGTLYGKASASASAHDSLWIYVKAASAAEAKVEAARRAEADTSAWAMLHVMAQQSQEVSVHAQIHLTCTNTDSAPSMECQVPEHIFVGDDAMYADFDTVDPDGDAISYGQPVTTGPIDIVMVESSVVNGKKHLAVKFRARDGVVPAGSSQSATISVTATAGGKSTTCSGSVTVENGRTGW